MSLSPDGKTIRCDRCGQSVPAPVQTSAASPSRGWLFVTGGGQDRHLCPECQAAGKALPPAPQKKKECR